MEDLRRQLLLAEQGMSEAIGRAERSEARELAHQDRWAAEIHTLRAAVEQLKGERTRRQALEEQVLRLQRELQALRRRLPGEQGA
jgi:predicted kinase